MDGRVGAAEVSVEEVLGVEEEEEAEEEDEKGFPDSAVKSDFDEEDSEDDTDLDNGFL